jgi:hypothetical protein
MSFLYQIICNGCCDELNVIGDSSSKEEAKMLAAIHSFSNGCDDIEIVELLTRGGNENDDEEEEAEE